MQKLTANLEKVGIIGAGPVGSLLSLYLAKRGLSSELYEKREDLRKEGSSAGRSINLAVSERGIHALSEVGLKEKVLEQAVPMRGRLIHSVNGQLAFQQYGKDTECIYSISRGGLNRTLIEEAEKTGKVEIHFQSRVVHFSEETGIFQVENNQGLSQERAHLVTFGTDGSSSVIRHVLAQQPGFSCTQEYLEYGYKEFTIPAGKNGEFLMKKEALHIWPRGAYMLIALPNFDGSFTCTLFLPLKGEPSFESLKNPVEVTRFFETQLSDVQALIPDFSHVFFSSPTGHMVTVKTFPWSYSDKILLLGDAAHAIVPFFGQGMNCGFEDCTVLNQLMDEEKDWAQLFSKFEKKRKSHTDGIADMAIENFVEMRDKVGDPKFLMEKEVEKILQKRFAEQYISRYSMVSFSRIPYRVAYESGVVQKEILADLCQNLNSPEQVDLKRAADLIETKLLPIIKQQLGV